MFAFFCIKWKHHSIIFLNWSLLKVDSGLHFQGQRVSGAGYKCNAMQWTFGNNDSISIALFHAKHAQLR